MAGKKQLVWPTHDAIVAAAREHGNRNDAARALGINESTFKSHLRVTSDLADRVTDAIDAFKAEAAAAKPRRVPRVADRHKHNYPPDDQLVDALVTGGFTAVAATIPCDASTLRSYCTKRGILDQVAERREQRRAEQQAAHAEGGAESELAQRARVLLKKPRTIEQLADDLDVSPRRVREVLDDLREAGFRVPEPDEAQDGRIGFAPVQPSKNNVHKSLSLLDGNRIRFGVVSDTHLASKEQALDELNLAYDYFADNGITEVLHPGDLVAGLGIYPRQVNDLLLHTYEAQVEHAVAVYPRRDGITTRLIAGNHDVEGQIGRLGANPLIAVCNKRDDMEHLGDYHAHVQLPNDAYVKMVHGRGGGAYALSYKPQKYVEGLGQGRKPALILFGHWHVSGFFRHRKVGCLLAGCFEWQTELLVRLGLMPDVGFWDVTLTLGEDGTVVRTQPVFLEFHQGRVVEKDSAPIAA